MKQYFLRRLLQAIPLLFVISLLTFGIVEIAPGDASVMYINPERGADPAYIEQVRESLGLNQPVHIRYLSWLEHTLTGDLGYSLRTRRPVSLENTQGSASVGRKHPPCLL